MYGYLDGFGVLFVYIIILQTFLFSIDPKSEKAGVIYVPRDENFGH